MWARTAPRMVLIMFLLYHSSGQGIMFDPPQDTGFYVCPTVEHVRNWAREGWPSAGRCPYRGTSLIRNSASLRPYSRNMPRALWWS